MAIKKAIIQSWALPTNSLIFTKVFMGDKTANRKRALVVCIEDPEDDGPVGEITYNLKILVGTVWKESNERYIMVGNSWKLIEKAYILVGNTWKCELA